ncbi:MAG: DNA polymerase III subunit alpha [bacterium P3]|nr:MAG: DNA polymerase III subunit alpha [bacterium P3]KWW42462.1 MAG: DNA polymerase III alpha subunit [bacterium F083]
MSAFTHLHVHSHYSILDGMSKIPDLVHKCKRDGMYAMALTDHGNMFGIKDLMDTVDGENDKVKKAIKEQQAILNNDGADPGAKQEAEYQIERLRGELFKPIIGIEAYCARRTLYDKDKTVKETNPETGRERITDRSGYHLILLAKNKQGYRNLCKLSSIAYIDGFYDRPRIDHNVLERYHEGIICCSACLGGEIPQLILRGDIAGAERSVLWFKQVFGDDYYLELQRHPTDKPGAATDVYRRQQQVNPVIIDLARKHGIKIVATNDVHFVEESHGTAHDHLICISTQSDYNDPNRMRYTQQEWLKSPAEMESLFADLPEALANTQKVADKVELYSINSDPIMPVFPIPDTFGSEAEYRSRITEEELFDEFTRNDKGEVVLSKEKADEKIHKLGGYDKLYRIKFEADYLAQLTWDGARRRYGDELNDEIRERINFELHTIKTMGFPGYFLIVQDYIRAAREELDVSVGPGRGSAAGSVVAYCLRITDVDPLKYDLLFERFLNPDRISLPDIDVDFDDAGRGKVLEWISDKYGREKVAHIITYGTMAAKSAIADVGRVEQIPLSTVNQIKSYIPERAFPDGMKDEHGKPFEKPPKLNLANCYKYVPELKSIMQSHDDKDRQLQPMLTYAEELEDTNRQIGIHACGVIIGADDLTKFAPMCTIYDKESKHDELVTQYDGHVVETVGLIKMDFLGLKNLTIIKDALRNIERRCGEKVDIDHIPIDDVETYQLFSRGDTIGTFQFESAGMQKHLRELQPTVFEDLIAMNALYRPGPMDYIPDFIDRKQGRKPIEYDIPCMETYLKETYGITVYQEQVMLLSRLLAGFTRGQSDTLRKAMGKKQISKMNELEVLFYEGGERNGHPRDKLHKIWEDWKKFASYAFNKSHATCYSWVAYQTAYLKAHYPADYMAATLTSGQTDIKRVAELMEECRRMGLDIMPPSVNESLMNFSVTGERQIRFGLKAILGMGEAAAEAIIAERERGGAYKDIFDFLSRIDLRTVNRKNIESLVKAGAFDGLGTMHRAQYFHHDGPDDDSPTFLEKLMRWAARKQESANSSQMSIFDISEEIKQEDHPAEPDSEPWTSIEQCRHEREVLGLYISGHPLDDFKYEIRAFTNTHLAALKDLRPLVGNDLRFAGLVTGARTGISQRNGDPYGFMTIEDYTGSYELRFFKDQLAKFKAYIEEGMFLYCRGTVEQWSHRDKEGKMQTSPPRLRISEIRTLGNLLDQFTTAILFHVDLDQVNNEFCQRIEQLANRHKGTTPLQIRIHDRHNDLDLLMQSNQLLVTPRSFIHELKSFNEVKDITPLTR